MQIKTSDGDKSVASKALGGTALGLAIPGTLAFLNQMGGLGGLFGGWNTGVSTPANVIAEADTRYISKLEGCINRLESERYTDGVGLELYKEIVAKSNAEDAKINANYKELAQFIAALDKQIAVDKQATVDNFAFLNNRIDTVHKELHKDIDCKINQVYCSANATFVPGKLVMPSSSVCPQPMPQYNSWTAPTTTTTTA